MKLRDAEHLCRFVQEPAPQSVDELPERLLLFTEGTLQAYYAPIDSINREARVAIVGLTPGWQQTRIAFQQYLNARAQGADVEAAKAEAKAAASFAGSMRTNLVSMLDSLGLHFALGLESSSDLFDQARHLLHTTSALRYPVFKNGGNYSGSPKPTRASPLRAMVEQLFRPELAELPKALLIPLGKAASECLEFLSEGGSLSRSQWLSGFPHPSGGNGHRVRTFEENRSRLKEELVEWFSRQPARHSNRTCE